MRQCFMLDLKDDEDLIAQYEEAHRLIPPEVARHLRDHGVVDIKIFRLGTRLCMVMDSDDAHHDAARMAHDTATDPHLMEWERRMWQFQAPTPWTPVGEKWLAAALIFDLKKQPQ